MAPPLLAVERLENVQFSISIASEEKGLSSISFGKYFAMIAPPVFEALEFRNFESLIKK